MQSSIFFLRRFLDLNRPRQMYSRSMQFCTMASGGFGKRVEQKSAAGKGVGKKQNKRKMKPPSNPMAPSQPSPNSREEVFVQMMEEKTECSQEDNLAFKKRLELLRKQGEATQKERAKQTPSTENVLASGPLSAPSSPAKQQQQKKEEATPLGVPQVAVGALSLLLVAVFVFTSGFGPGGDSSLQSEEGLTQEQLKDLQTRSEELDKTLKKNPEDVASLRELSDLSAVLGDFKKSSSLAELTTKAVPTDSKAWLALGDARGRLTDYRGAVTAYEKAIETSKAPSLSQLRGLTTALMADKRPSEAVQRLQGFESQAGSSGAVSKVELQLLIGKVYSQWDRHSASALAVYDGIIDKFPDDFRGYLARGALLKENGRKGDAQRMFIQARFLAPPEARAVVDDVASR